MEYQDLLIEIIKEAHNNTTVVNTNWNLREILYMAFAVFYNTALYIKAYLLFSSDDYTTNIINIAIYNWQKKFISTWFFLFLIPLTIAILATFLRLKILFSVDTYLYISTFLLTFIFGLNRLKINYEELKYFNIHKLSEEYNDIRNKKQLATPPPNVKKQIISNDKYGSLKLNELKIVELKHKIEHFLEKDQCYLDAELNVNIFSELINEKPHVVSQAINTIFDKKFSELINSYRINHVKKLLKENPNNKVMHIAYDSGFKSRTTFNTQFKNNTGLTPTEYKKRLDLLDLLYLRKPRS